MEDRIDTSGDEIDSAMAERPVAVGGDERRMHVRAYNYWVSLLQGRAYPSIEDLDPENLADFGTHSVLLDFTGGLDDPAIRFLGKSLRTECGVDATITHVSQVPSRSLLSRLTDHYLQIIANRAPIGFEAEFVSQRGFNTMYRGILMPFSSDEDTIDFIYGVINWKELVDAETQAQLNAEIEQARRAVPRPPFGAPVWADGPSSGFEAVPSPEPEVLLAEAAAADSRLYGDSLDEKLNAARDSAAVAQTTDVRSRAALYRALGRAYDFALAAERDGDGYAALLAAAGIKAQERAPMTPIAKLVFGADYDKTRLTEFATVLTHARRLDTRAGGLEALLDAADGGIKGLVQAERARRGTPPTQRSYSRAAARLRDRAPLAHVAIAAEGDDFVLLLARPAADGTLDVVAQVADDPKLTERVVRRAAG